MRKTLAHAYTSIGKKQIVALTGLVLVFYVIIHLAGNLFIYAGPEVFNGYAKKLADLRPGLSVIEAGLLLVFLVHIYFTVLVVIENRRARPERYLHLSNQGRRSPATRTMALSGLVVLAFVVWHLLDFTFTDHHGPRSMINGESLGLYGVVYNSFADPVHSAFYIIAMVAVGSHLAHGVESFCQTFGFNHPKYFPMIQNFSRGFAALIVVGYSSIPVWVLALTAGQ